MGEIFPNDVNVEKPQPFLAKKSTMPSVGKRSTSSRFAPSVKRMSTAVSKAAEDVKISNKNE